MRKFIVICFMSNDEYNDGHVVGSINIPYDEINENIEVLKDKVNFGVL